MNEEPTDNEISQPSLDGLFDRLSSKDMIGGRHQIKAMLYTKLKDRLDSLNASSAPLPHEEEQTIEESGVGAAMTTDKLVTQRRGFDRHYREFPKEFVWAAEKDGKVVDTAVMNVQDLQQAHAAIREIASNLADKGADTVKIMGRGDKLLSTMKIDGQGKVTNYESVESGGWNLGALDDIKGTGKAKKPFNKTNIREKIVKQGSKFVILSKDGDKKLGEYDNEDAAKKRLRQIEFFKRKH
jgi:hypothetical protein